MNVRQTGTPACLELGVRWMVVSAKGVESREWGLGFWRVLKQELPA